MTNEERDLITSFVQRVGGRPAAAGGFAGSVPQAGQPNLPPVDPQADALLTDLFARYPEARYRITQLAFVQEHALAEATNQISQLQAALQQARAAAQAPAPAAAPSPWGQQPTAAPAPQPSRGFLGSLFGSSQPQPQPQYAPQPMMAPAPQYAPGYQPGMFQRSGSGFLGSALTTAAGVAGGVMAANALTSLFSGSGSHEHGWSGNSSFGGGGGGGGGFVPDQTALPSADASPWATPPAADPYAQGGAAKDYDQASYQPAPDAGGWTDSSSSDSGGWTDTNNC